MSDDDLLARAEALIRAEEARSDPPPTGLAAHSRGLRRVLLTGQILWARYLRPVWRLFNWPLSRYWRLCRWLFRRMAFRGTVYSAPRGAAAIVLLSVFTLFFGYHLAVNAIPLAARFTYDAVAINALSRTETLVFSQPNPVEGRPGELAVYACRKYPCEAQFDSVEFRMRDSVYLDALSYVRHFQPHDPGELAGAFVSEENGCKVRSYGKRIKVLGTYPMLTHAVCQPINAGNSVEVLQAVADARLR